MTFSTRPTRSSLLTPKTYSNTSTSWKERFMPDREITTGDTLGKVIAPPVSYTHLTLPTTPYV